MGISFKLFNELVDIVTDVNKPVLLRSRHGVGKSMVVYQYGDKKNLPVVERRASQMTEGDLLGLPKLVGGTTTFLPPDWYKQACKEPVILFIDEIDRATPEVRQGFFELTDSRKIAGHELHPGTLIFAAINGGEHAAQYQVGEMDPAESDRWTVFDLEPTVEDWLDWAKDNCHKMVVTFIRENHKHLEHAQGEFEPGKVYPSRRSWHRFSDALTKAEENGMMLAEPGEVDYRLSHLTQAFCGLEASVAFVDYVKNMEKQMSADDVMKKGLVDKTKDFTISDHSNLIEKIKDAGYFTKKWSKKELDNFVKYWFVLPSEIAMKVVVDIAAEFAKVKATPEKSNVIRFGTYPGVREHIQEIAGQKEVIEALKNKANENE